MTHCPSPERLLDSIIRDGALSEDEQAHVANCDHCQPEVASFDEIITALESAKEETVPPEWVERVLASLPAPPEAAGVARPPRTGILGSFQTFGLATVTVFLALLFFAPGGIGNLALGLGYALAVGTAATLVEVVLTRSQARATPA